MNKNNNSKTKKYIKRQCVLKERDKNKLIRKALLKKASGFIVEEKIEEYMIDNGIETLCKKKISTKEIPPDINAVKALIELEGFYSKDYENLSDEELENEKQKLLELLKTKEEENDC